MAGNILVHTLFGDHKDINLLMLSYVLFVWEVSADQANGENVLLPVLHNLEILLKPIVGTTVQCIDWLEGQALRLFQLSVGFKRRPSMCTLKSLAFLRSTGSLSDALSSSRLIVVPLRLSQTASVRPGGMGPLSRECGCG